MEAEIGVILPQTKNSRSHHKLEEARNASPPEPSEGYALPTPWFQTSGFQSCERINFCSLKPPHHSNLLRQF